MNNDNDLKFICMTKCRAGFAAGSADLLGTLYYIGREAMLFSETKG